MCGSMVDIQSPTAEIRRGKKKKKKDRNHRAKILHRATIIIQLFRLNDISERLAGRGTK